MIFCVQYRNKQWDLDLKWHEWCIMPLICIVRLYWARHNHTLIFVWIMPQVQDRSLDPNVELQYSVPPLYTCVTTDPVLHTVCAQNYNQAIVTVLSTWNFYRPCWRQYKMEQMMCEFAIWIDISATIFSINTITITTLIKIIISSTIIITIGLFLCLWEHWHYCSLLVYICACACFDSLDVKTCVNCCID